MQTKVPPTGFGTPTSTTLVQTPNVTRIRAFMDEAKEKIEGIEFRFTVARFDSLAQAKERATSLQNQVSSIRARARNTAQVRVGQKNNVDSGEQIRGQYDDLVCFKRLLPNGEGYVVVIGPSTSQEDDFEVYDRATGEQILQEDPRTKRINQLIEHWTDKLFNKDVHPPYFTYEQEREMYDLSPDQFRLMFSSSNLPLPAWVSGLDAIAVGSDAPVIDLLDTPLDDFGVGEDGAV